MHESLRMRAVQSPVIPIVGEWTRSCHGTISLGQGIVHYGPPRQASEAITRFGSDPSHHRYGPVEGIPPLQTALAAKLRTENGIDPDAGYAIVVTAGANMGFMNAVLAIADPGDEIILPTPYYFNHEMAIVMASCRPVPVPTDGDYQLRLDDLRSAITPRTRAIVTVSPNNPSGAVYPEATLRAVNDLCKDHGIYHISDEAYEYFTYDGARHYSPGSGIGSSDHTISLYSLSKAYGFAGWRIGYMVIPMELLGPVKKIQDTVLICPPVISQYAAIGALEAGPGYCREHLREIAKVRHDAIKALSPIRSFCDVPSSQGAFYLLLLVDSRMNSMELVERLIREHGVAVLPGTTFGMEQCAVRVGYAALRSETVAEGIGRLVSGMKSLAGG